MRGKPFLKNVVIKEHRITPADAGKTHYNDKFQFLHRDHPRGCGENQSSPNPAHNNIGSPPRMRGKHRDYSIADPRGKDHPRGCGENQFKGLDNIYFKGSPPRMRGKRIDYKHKAR